MRTLLLLMCSALAGCASGPKYAEIERSIPALQPEMGRIYFYRPSAIGAMIRPNILLNGELIGEMVPRGFFYVDRAPGTYVASAKTESEASVQIPLEANQTRYVRGSISLGIVVGRPNLALVDGPEGLQEVKELSYAGTSPLAQGASAAPAAAAAATAAATAVAAPQATAAAAVYAPAHPGLPAVGTTWKYSFADQRYSSGFQLYTVRVTAVDGWKVQESFDPGNGTQTSVTVDVKHLDFLARRLDREQVVMEVGPYFYATELAKSDTPAHIPSSYPLSTGAWRIESARISEEVAVVPAGTFKALRLDINGSNFQAAVGNPRRFEYTAWYAPEVKRYVMLRHRSWARQGTPFGDEVVKLVEYRTN